MNYILSLALCLNPLCVPKFCLLETSSTSHSQLEPSQWHGRGLLSSHMLKKPKLECILKNYRPVLNLPSISKLIKKAAIKQIQDHSDNNNTTPTHQSAYRVHHSCETALLFLHNEILSSFEKQEITNLCTIDLSAAFDTVGHSITISTMENNFGL